MQRKLTAKAYKNYKIRWLPKINYNGLQWKDKFGSPRCEVEPCMRIEWLKFGWFFSLGDDEYWEQWLWLFKYNNGDIRKAERTWPWSDMSTGKSTWRLTHGKKKD